MARQELSAQTVRGQGGGVALERFSDRLDALLQELCAEAPRPSCDAAVLAVGGYGRRHLCLHSDLDLLVLFDGAIGARDEQFLRAVLHPLWDLGLVVGHQVREVNEFSRLDTNDPTFLLALADARAVAGNRALGDHLTAIIDSAEARAFMVQSLWRLIDERYAAFNDTLYQLEPDVKDAPGALRDLTALRTIVRLTDPALLDQSPADRVCLDEAEEFLLRIRSILHMKGRRNQNVLTHEMQEHVAQVLRYPGSTPRQQVERLMGDYFRHARSVGRAVAWTRQTAPVPVGANLVRSRDGIRFVDAEQARTRPETWLNVFHTAIEIESAVAYETLSLLQQHVDYHVAEDFFPTPADRAALLAFLKPRPGLYARLSELHDCRLLGQIFPEFAGISCRVVRDFYHKYTVDEHTLLTIRNLERLAAPASPPGRERFAELVGTEEHLKMLCLLTLVDVEAVSPETMTPWREELLWRLYVDTYNHLTLGYGDELIDRSQSDLSELLAHRPSNVSEAEITRFVEGLPRRYLRLFAPETIYRHVQLSRDIQPDHVHAALEPKGAAWEVTVVTLDN